MTPTDQSTADLWRIVVGTTYQESVLAYGNMHSNHGPEDDEHLPEGREAARYVALTALSAATGVPAHTISLLASRAADAYGHAPDADYHAYLAEPDWDAVRDGTYEPRDPWGDVEPDEDDVPPDIYVIEIREAWRRHTLGWRVQVFDDTGRPLLDESRLPRRKVGPWRSTYEGARLLGMSKTYEIHAMDDAPGPLVVYLNGQAVIDER